MNASKEKDFRERSNAAAQAKKAQVEKFRTKLATPDPAAAERKAARAALIADRGRRAEAREAERKAAAAKRAAEEAAAAVEAAAQAQSAAEAQRAADEARNAEFIAEQERAIALKAEQKAKRDARYAARKARK